MLQGRQTPSLALADNARQETGELYNGGDAFKCVLIRGHWPTEIESIYTNQASYVTGWASRFVLF